MRYSVSEARETFRADAAHLAQAGVVLNGATSYLPDGFASNFDLAMDAQPTLVTTPNGGIPAFLTTLVDPEVIEIIFAPNKGAEIFGEVKKGTWVDQTAIFPVVEHTGEVSSYGDYLSNGRAGANTNFPQRQQYLFQTVKEYGELELERAGAARIGWAAEIDKSAATVMNKFHNLTYFFGVSGLQNYGLLNDPGLSAPLTPSTKAATGTAWMNGNIINATANEVYADIQSLFAQAQAQAGGNLEQDAAMTLAMSPTSAVALTATNQFNVNVADLLAKNFPNLKVKTAPQYGQKSATNPQGVTGGSLVQLIVEKIEGQKTGYCAFGDKMRSHPVIRDLSAFRQKVTGGSWGAIVRQPFAFSQMLGV